MLYYSLLCLIGMFSIQAMDNQISDRNAEDYVKTNGVGEQFAFKWLQESSICLNNKDILDVGCGTGNITTQLLKMGANSVDGVDASHNMITYAREHFQNPNLSFQQSLIEDFKNTKRYDLAVSFFCLHWVKDKEAAFKRISKSLKNNGEFFGTIISSSDPMPLDLVVGLELITQILQNNPHFNITLPQPSDGHPTDEVIKEMLDKAHLNIVSYEKKLLDFTINRANLETMYKTFLMVHPLLQALSYEEKMQFFGQYITLFLSKLNKNNSDQYHVPLVYTTVIHARKQK